MKRFLKLLRLHWLLWVMVIAPTITLIGAPVGMIYWSAYTNDNPDCASQVTSLLRSPNTSQVAVARDEDCVLTGIGGSSWTVQCVHIVREGKEAGHHDEVFCIHDYVPGARLVLNWSSSNNLQITAPNTSIVAMRKARFDGVNVEVKFDPDDPVARKEWLRSQGRTDGQINSPLSPTS